MTVATKTLPTTARPERVTPRRSIVLVLVNWLVERDRLYREGRKLAAMPRERLEDMGIAPGAAEFYARHGNRPTDAAPIPLSPW